MTLIDANEGRTRRKCFHSTFIFCRSSHDSFQLERSSGLKMLKIAKHRNRVQRPTRRLPCGLCAGQYVDSWIDALEPVEKLQSAALLLDFWLGQGVRAAAIPAAVLPMICIALRAAFGQAVSLRSAVPPEQRRSSQKDTQPCGREQERPSGRVARSVTARCGDAPSRAPCHTAFLALVRRFLIFSQVLSIAQVLADHWWNGDLAGRRGVLALRI
jgi:hypothetical protein